MPAVKDHMSYLDFPLGNVPVGGRGFHVLQQVSMGSAGVFFAGAHFGGLVSWETKGPPAILGCMPILRTQATELEGRLKAQTAEPLGFKGSAKATTKLRFREPLWLPEI